MSKLNIKTGQVVRVTNGEEKVGIVIDPPFRISDGPWRIGIKVRNERFFPTLNQVNPLGFIESLKFFFGLLTPSKIT